MGRAKASACVSTARKEGRKGGNVSDMSDSGRGSIKRVDDDDDVDDLWRKVTELGVTEEGNDIIRLNRSLLQVLFPP